VPPGCGLTETQKRKRRRREQRRRDTKQKQSQLSQLVVEVDACVVEAWDAWIRAVVKLWRGFNNLAGDQPLPVRKRAPLDAVVNGDANEDLPTVADSALDPAIHDSPMAEDMPQDQELEGGAVTGTTINGDVPDQNEDLPTAPYPASIDIHSTASHECVPRICPTAPSQSQVASGLERTKPVSERAPGNSLQDTWIRLTSWIPGLAARAPVFYA
jgi:hypothetical protein